MSRERRVLTSSAFLLVANVSAGVIHYLYQVRAAAQLDAASYGTLNGWLAYLSVALFLGVATQIASNFLVLTEPRLRRLAWLTIAATLLGLGWLVGMAVAIRQPTAFEFGVVSLVLGTLQQWIVGQFQSRTWFVWMGSSFVLIAIVKLGSTLLPMVSHVELDAAYFWSFPLSFGVGCLFQCTVMLGRMSHLSATQTEVPVRGNRPAWMAALTLALAVCVLPQLDMLNLRGSQSDYALGSFARAALFAKAIFFAALTLLQVALPYHVRAHRHQVQTEADLHIRRLERFGVTACVAGSFVLAALAPWVTSRLLGFELLAEQQLWVLLSCLALTALYGHLQAIQVYCATGEWPRALARLAAVTSLYPMVQLFGRHTSVGTYLATALAYYVAIEVLWRLHAATRRDAEVRQTEQTQR